MSWMGDKPMKKLNEGLELANKKRALRDIDIAIKNILGIGYFDKAQPFIHVPCENDQGGVDIELPEVIATSALRICRIIFYIEITFAKLKNHLREGNK
jgi:hypothetical protein